MDPRNPDATLSAKLEVLEALQDTVGTLLQQHESRRELWWPSDLVDQFDSEDTAAGFPVLRERARGLPPECRIALALNLATEEGLPHFHRLIATYLGDNSNWREWQNLWTAEEDRHGAVLHDYCRITRILDAQAVDRLKFDYLRSGFYPHWERDPYRILVYTSLQERATQRSHARTGRLCGNYEPLISNILEKVTADEARHFTFYQQAFARIIELDPDQALVSALEVVPGLEMPGIGMPGFSEFAEVVRRAGIYGPREYLQIVEGQLKSWKIDALTGLSAVGRVAQEKLMAVPDRLRRIADIMERRRNSRTFSFDLLWGRSFSLEG
ncbi:MAG: acyl-ACP desaturase [Pseudomonadales bacterium]